MPSLTHDQLQSTCFLWAWNLSQSDGPYPHMCYRFFSVPNSAAGYLGAKKAKQLQACGLVAGVWDMPIFDSYGACHWIEFKVGKDTVSLAQKKFRNAMLPLGNHFFYVVHEDPNIFSEIFTNIATDKIQSLLKFQYNDR